MNSKYIEGWNEADFVSKRMEDKIDFLKDHLPDFLVNNSKVYSILSLGIHELDEETCLNFFEVLKHSIFFILDEDEQKRKELELRNKIGKAIATFFRKRYRLRIIQGEAMSDWPLRHRKNASRLTTHGILGLDCQQLLPAYVASDGSVAQIVFANLGAASLKFVSSHTIVTRWLVSK